MDLVYLYFVLLSLCSNILYLEKLTAPVFSVCHPRMQK